MSPQPPERLNALRMSGVDLANYLSRGPATDSKGRKVTLTPGALTHWVAAGCPRNADKTYNLMHVCQWLAGCRGETSHRPPAETDEMDKAKLADIRSRTKLRDQARLAAEKNLVNREQIHEEWMLLLHGVKIGLTTLARVLVKEVVGQPEPVVKAKVEERTNDTLKSFAEGWDDEAPEPKP